MNLHVLDTAYNGIRTKQKKQEEAYWIVYNRYLNNVVLPRI